MTTLINYVAEVNAGIILISIGYWLLIRNETDFRVQRGYLLAGLAAALILPLLQVQATSADVVGTLRTNTIVLLPELTVSEGQATYADSYISLATVLVSIYFIVILFLLVPFLVSLVKMRALLRRSVATYENGYYVIESELEGMSWSFFNLIWIGGAARITKRERDLIVMHESLHGKLWHSADVLFTTIISILFWFNPAAWMIRRVLMKVHEYQVDSMVAGKADINEYCILLAKSALPSPSILLAHHFNQSFILKRIKMINKIKQKVSGWKLLALATTIVSYGVVVSCTEPVKESVAVESGVPAEVNARLQVLNSAYPAIKFTALSIRPAELTKHLGQLQFVATGATPDRVWIVVREGDGLVDEAAYSVVDDTAHPLIGLQKFYERLADTMHYPDVAAANAIEGSVFVRFTVLEDGRMADFAIASGLSPDCDAEAIRAISNLDVKWEPGKINGEPVQQKLVLPVTFKLN